MNYKHIETGAVISENCYNKLPFGKRVKFHPCSDSQGNFLTEMLLSIITNDTQSDTTNSIETPNSDPPSTDFGGGDFGGGGGGSDY